MVVRIMPFQVTACGLSDVGLIRRNNEDVWAEELESSFFVLADGMGGHQAGEVAAREAVRALCDIVKQFLGPGAEHRSVREVSHFIKQAIEEVNYIVHKMGNSDENLRGMGTTLCCLYFHREKVIYAHVGDSRIYRLRKKKLRQLTKDHSLLCELVDLGELSAQQAMDFLYKNIVTKAVGTEPHVEPSVHTSEMVDGDLYLMCSDGLSDLLKREEMETILNNSANIYAAAKKLVATAKEKGGHDNVTVVLTKVEEFEESEKNLS